MPGFMEILGPAESSVSNLLQKGKNENISKYRSAPHA